jgi:hypothetical protein
MARSPYVLYIRKACASAMADAINRLMVIMIIKLKSLFA